MKYIIFGMLLVGSALAHAYDPLYNEYAAAVCSRLSYDSDKQACMTLIKGKQFSNNAVVICSSFNYDSDKKACLEVIADRHFLSPIEVSACGKRAYDSDKKNCLQNASSEPFRKYSRGGAPRGGGYSKEVILHQVNEAIEALDDQNIGKARALLYSVQQLLDTP